MSATMDQKPPATVAEETNGAASTATAPHPQQQQQHLFQPPPIDEVTESIEPSHFAPDGRTVFLPRPDQRERNRFFERSIARYGLLEADMAAGASTGEKNDDDDDGTTPSKKDGEEQKRVHPLALASARIQADGVNELNRAINLSTLVRTGEYFGLSNIVDPSLEIPSATAAAAAAAAETQKGGDTGSASQSKSQGAENAAAGGGGGPHSEGEIGMQEEQRIKATYVLKRKRAQFESAATILGRHQQRMAAAITAQSRPDARLRCLRPQWRLVAPSHGTRARPHAARPQEVVAADVDVYSKEGSVLGRLAKRVPRYATMELKDDYDVVPDLREWETRHGLVSSIGGGVPVKEEEEEGDDDTEMEVDSPPNDTGTRAEPYALADPTLGKLDADFDPSKVAMLSLQFDIEKPSTGFCQTATMQPVAALSPASGEESSSYYRDDEKVLVALQHSLFCAKLFESIRRELAPDTEEIGQLRTTAKAQSVVWIGGEAEQNFLPPPSLMGGDPDIGLARLCVIHCHEGEVKVQLDSEYTLRVRLVEASAGTATADATTPSHNGRNTRACLDSGSETPAQLLRICRALLWHAQETHHRHAVETATRLQEQEDSEDNKEMPTRQQQRKKKVEDATANTPSPRILQSCVSLGSKILFESRVRKTIKKVQDWLTSAMRTDEKLVVDWLSLSFFDQHSLFTLSFLSWSVDVDLTCEELTLTRFTPEGEYRKVTFHTDTEFELYLKISLRRVLQ